MNIIVQILSVTCLRFFLTDSECGSLFVDFSCHAKFWYFGLLVTAENQLRAGSQECQLLLKLT